jgi:transcriptional regulator with XRE-family HTH domain
LNEDYPAEPKTFGEKLRKARMDAGVQIKELAAIIGVADATVINWDIRGMRPWNRRIRKSMNNFISSSEKFS